MSEIDDLYREVLGRERDSTERGSEEENAGKYGMDSIRKSLESRKSNTPGGERREEEDQRDARPSGGGGGNSSPAQAWNAAPSAQADPFPAWYKELMTSQAAQQQVDTQQRAAAAAQAAAQQQAAQAEAKAKSDALYGQLDTRAKQGLQVNAQDPIIKGQVDAFSAQGERSRRGYLSDVAERSGPYANMRGEQRMTAEKLGQGTAGFQAELLGRELSSRRDEIAQALSTQGAILSGDQTRNLQAQLAQMDQGIKEAGLGLQGRQIDQQGALGFSGQALQRDLGFADLSLRDKLGMGALDMQGRGLDLQRELGMGGLALQGRGLDISSDQFLRELALREWDLGDQSDWRWAGL